MLAGLGASLPPALSASSTSSAPSSLSSCAVSEAAPLAGGTAGGFSLPVMVRREFERERARMVEAGERDRSEGGGEGPLVAVGGVE